MLYVLIIFLEIFILLLLSRILPSNIISLIYFFIRSRKWSIWIFSLIFLPGTIIHELAHLLTAGVLFVNTGEISLFPEIREEGVKLGHVEIQKTDPIRRALIGFAPVFAGLASLGGIIFYATSIFFQKGDYPLWIVVLTIYLCLIIGNTMFSSKKDLEGSLFVVIIFFSIIATIYFLGFHNLFAFIKEKGVLEHVSFYQNFSYFLAIPVISDLIVYLFTKILVRKLY